MFENIWTSKTSCFLMMTMGTVDYLDLIHIYRPAAIMLYHHHPEQVSKAKP